jgi:hypothetical protein
MRILLLRRVLAKNLALVYHGDRQQSGVVSECGLAMIPLASDLVG